MSKAELQRTVEEQRKQISAYEKRLKDVIRAYKSLLAEKEALECSLHALKVDDDNRQQLHDGQKQKEQDQNQSTDEPSASHSAQAAGEQEGDLILTLQKSLKTITLEKSRKEAAFAADKKQLLQEQEKQRGQWKSELGDRDQQIALLNQQVAELRATLRQEQLGREADQRQQHDIVKELHMKVAQQRQQQDDQAIKAAVSVSDQDSRSSALSQQVASLKQQLKGAEQRAQKEQTALKQSMEQQQRGHSRLVESLESQLDTERRRAAAAERKLQATDATAAEGYEDRMQELLASLAETQQQRGHDLHVIERLKHRVNQFEKELNEQATVAADAAAVIEAVDTMDAEALAALLQRAATTATQRHAIHHVKLYELVGLESPYAESAHADCRQRQDELRQELRRCQANMHSALSKYEPSNRERLVSASSSQQAQSSTADADAALRSEVDRLRRQLAENDTRLNRDIESLQSKLVDSQREFDRQLTSMKNECEQKVAEAEMHAQRQRDRAQTLLDEKQQELETSRKIMAQLRANATTSSTAGTTDGGSGSATAPPADPNTHRQSIGSRRSVSPTMTEFTGGSGGPHSQSNVHYERQLQQRALECDQLRKQLHQLQVESRDLHHSAVTRHLQHSQTIEHLKEEIRSQELKLRLYTENANLEYLKNVLLQYMLCDSAAGRRPMLKAIAQLLKFTQSELNQVRAHNDRTTAPVTAASLWSALSSK